MDGKTFTTKKHMFFSFKNSWLIVCEHSPLFFNVKMIASMVIKPKQLNFKCRQTKNTQTNKQKLVSGKPLDIQAGSKAGHEQVRLHTETTSA